MPTPNKPTAAAAAVATARAVNRFRHAGSPGGGGGGAGGGGGSPSSPSGSGRSVRPGTHTRRASVVERLDHTIAVEVSRTANDLESGALQGGAEGEGGVVREQFVKVRTPSQAAAMGAFDRRLVQLHGAFESVKNLALDKAHFDFASEEGAGAPAPAQLSDVAESGGAGSEAAAEQAQAQDSERSAGAAAPAEGEECGRGGGPARPRTTGGVQYRLESRRKDAGGCCAHPATSDATDFAAQYCCCDINRWINGYLHWTFRTSFAVLLLSMIVVFVGMTVLFAALILWSGANNHMCIASAAFKEWDEYTNRERFADAYQLSWTTFSTVGYGLIYPETSSGFTVQRDCIGIKILCSFEAFFGVLFSGLCGAILFSKVSRIQGFAQVIFSDPIVVRYGSGVAGDSDSDDDEDDDGNGKGGGGGGDEEEGARAGGEHRPRRHMPCPILEFRIANRLNNTPGGEIMDATLNCVGSIDARHACPDILKTVDTHRRPHGRGLLRRRRHHHTAGMARRGGAGDPPEGAGERRSSMDQSNNGLRSSVVGVAAPAPPDDVAEGKPLALVTPKTSTGSLAAAADAPDPGSTLAAGAALLHAAPHQAMEEDSSDLAPRRIFSKMEIQTHSHPFFKRVWLARHVLNEHSPLLTNRARRMVRKNHGHWPAELNNYAEIRNSICFNQILVSLSGTCNVTGASVYAQKIYHFVDIVVGYKFANALFRDRDSGSLRVDLNLIDDVQEQDGEDDAEPLEGEAIGETQR